MRLHHIIGSVRENEVWEGQGLGPTLARTALTPLSWLYALGWQTYLGVYRVGFKRAAEPHRPVVCIGNLRTGGSGKTPVTIRVAELLLSQNQPVIIGCSGYGFPHAEAAAVAPDGPLIASEWGDEPALIRDRLPNVPLMVGRRRVLAAELAHQLNPNAVLLMDDGFQHLPLKKHVSILLDATDPMNPRCLPAGPYREPRFNRRRADEVLPGRFTPKPLPMRLLTPSGEENHPQRYSVLCALARPELFLRALHDQFPPTEPAFQKLLIDHDPLSAGTLLNDFPSDRPIIVTAKDWVKLRERPDVETRSFLIATHEVRIEPEDTFIPWLMSRIHG